MLNTPFLRIDVDNCHYRQYWRSFHRRYTKYPNWMIPGFIQPAYDLKEWLKDYSIERVWMFRNLTTPNKWDEPFGLHVDNLNNFVNELIYIETRLGPVEYWNTHGHGREWSQEELMAVQEEYKRECLNLVGPVYSVKSCTATEGYGGKEVEDVDLTRLKQIIFHPIYFHTAQLDTLKEMLVRIQNADA